MLLGKLSKTASWCFPPLHPIFNSKALSRTNYSSFNDLTSGPWSISFVCCCKRPQGSRGLPTCKGLSEHNFLCKRMTSREKESSPRRQTPRKRKAFPPKETQGKTVQALTCQKNVEASAPRRHCALSWWLGRCAPTCCPCGPSPPAWSGSLSRSLQVWGPAISFSWTSHLRPRVFSSS